MFFDIDLFLLEWKEFWNETITQVYFSVLDQLHHHVFFFYLWSCVENQVLFYIFWYLSWKHLLFFHCESQNLIPLHIVKGNFLDLWTLQTICRTFLHKKQKILPMSYCDSTEALVLRITLLNLFFHYPINVPWTIHDNKMPKHYSSKQ